MTMPILELEPAGVPPAASARKVVAGPSQEASSRFASTAAKATSNPAVKRLFLLLGLVAIVAAAWFWWKGEAAAQVPSYRTAPIERGSVSSKVSATGTLQAVTRIDVGSQVSGMITAVYVSHNSLVSKGQVLAQLDPSAYQTAITQAVASVNNAESSIANAQADAAGAKANVRAADASIVSALAQVEQAQVGVSNGEAAIAGSEARLAKVQSARDNARRSLGRSQDLYNRELVAEADLDAAQTALDGAEADVGTAQADLQGSLAGLRSAQVQVKVARAEVESARIKRESTVELVAAAQARIRGYQAQVTQAQANLRTAEINLERTTITSPIDGVVLGVAITAGQTVAAQLQAPNLFTLAQDLRQMQVETSVDEADISQVRKGAKAQFTVDALPEAQFGGTVTEVRQSPIATSGVVTYLVIISTKNASLQLKPGMTATVEIIEQERKDVLMVPTEALSFQPAPAGDAEASPLGSKVSKPTGAGVYTLENARLVRHQVKTGLSDGIQSELLSGDLKEGQEVVLATLSADGASPSTTARKSGSTARPPSGRLF